MKANGTKTDLTVTDGSLPKMVLCLLKEITITADAPATVLYFLLMARNGTRENGTKERRVCPRTDVGDMPTMEVQSTRWFGKMENL